MARLFKQQYTRPIPDGAEIVEREGKRFARFKLGRRFILAPLTNDGHRCRVQSDKWYTTIHDANGKAQRVALATNREAAEMMRGALLRRAEMREAGAGDPFEDQRNRPLAEHLADYRSHLHSKGSCDEHVELTVVRIRNLFDGCGFSRIGDLSASRIAEWLADARSAGVGAAQSWPIVEGTARNYAEIARCFGVCGNTVRYWRLQGAPIKPRRENDLKAIARWRHEWESRAPGIGIATSNGYLTAAKAFCRWLVRDHRTDDNPLTHLQSLNAQTDVRRERRTLTPNEFGRLIEAARTGEPFRGISGPDRAMLYVTAGYTGLRESELASLTAVSFDFDSDPPTVTIEAAYSKRRRRDVLPLRLDLARLVREWLPQNAHRPICVLRMAVDRSDAAPVVDRAQAAKLWPGTWTVRGAEMIRRDLKAAGIVYRDDAGRVFDFHALRHQFISSLAQAGVHPKEAQRLRGIRPSASLWTVTRISAWWN